MPGHLVLSVLLTLVCVVPTYAAGPEDDPPPVPPNMSLEGPALTTDQMLTDDGPLVSVLPATTGPRHRTYRGLATVRGSDDCNCCAEYFGGFGPLWETYCADKNRCWGAAACGPSRGHMGSGYGCRAGCTPLVDGSRRHSGRARVYPGSRVGPSCDCLAPQ